MKFKNMFSAILLILLLASVTFGATHNNQTVVKSELWGGLVYSGTVTFTDSASGAIYYTQAMLIGAVDKAQYGFIDVDCSEVGTEDVNVFIEYSKDKVLWTAGTTDTDLDACGTTAVLDTIGIVQATACNKYLSYPYMRLKFVAGQAMNPTVVTWGVVFKKSTYAPKEKIGSVESYPTS